MVYIGLAVFSGVGGVVGYFIRRVLVDVESNKQAVNGRAKQTDFEALKDHVPGAIPRQVSTGPAAEAGEGVKTAQPPTHSEEQLGESGSGPATATGDRPTKHFRASLSHYVTKIVYYDARYPAAWVQGENATQARDYFVKRSFTEKNAEQLREWMGEVLSAALAYKSLIVFAQDIVPDTVAEVRNETCLIRKYLDAGGRVVWRGDIPFWYQGKATGAKDNWYEGDPFECAPWKILGVYYYNYRMRWNPPKGGEGLIWSSDVPSELTPAGRDIGLRYPRKRISARPVPCEDVDMTYVLIPQRDFSVLDANLRGSGGDFALCWKKNFNEHYPHGGFMQYVPGDFVWKEVNDDFFRFAVSGWPLLFDG